MMPGNSGAAWLGLGVGLGVGVGVEVGLGLGVGLGVGVGVGVGLGLWSGSGLGLRVKLTCRGVLGGSRARNRANGGQQPPSRTCAPVEVVVAVRR